jgi:hypothetical protein
MGRSLCSAVNKLFFVISRTLFNWIFRCHSHKSPSIFPILSQINPIRSLSNFLYKISSILSSQLHVGLNNFLFLSGFATKSTFIYLFHSHLYYIPHPPHPPLLDHPNNIWIEAEIMKLPIVKYSPSICYFPLSPNIFSSSWFSSTPSLPSQYPQ